ncbi:universal stress protein [Streptomyces sp. KS 21]|uniref:universal stress protein n=1 Tax=Streptomyces sp. KS 21 TaxID=2485150 RepID=UPI001062FA31|nr:universal stress protein [Streptomyces sp. KS 21]TDU79753.1 universal stress protein family protein [Streptomyces sp. KS 21]
MSNRIAVGLDGSGAGSTAADSAANEAELRGAALELVHEADGLEATLRELPSPWEQKHPRLAADARSAIGQPAVQVLDAGSGAALVVVGRRIRRPALGARIGPITHAVMHHATSPVAVVAHD